MYTGDGGGPVDGQAYLERLRHAEENQRSSRAKLHFHEETGEHRLDLKYQGRKQRVFYPTLKSIQLRLDLAKKYNTGVAVIDLPAGLDYFYDLL